MRDAPFPGGVSGDGGEEGREPARDPREAILTLIPRLRTRARSLAPDPAGADDLVRDAITGALLAWDGPGRVGADLEAWLLAILHDRAAFPADGMGREGAR